MNKHRARGNRFRDFIYDVSDILIVLLIILVAAAIIIWRVSAIMNYSAGGSLSLGETEISQTDDSYADSEAKSEVSADSSASEDKSSGGRGTVYEITVSKGETADEIAAVLKDAGLISDTQEFMDAVSDAGAEDRIREGTYSIEKGSTADEIVTVLTS